MKLEIEQPTARFEAIKIGECFMTDYHGTFLKCAVYGETEVAVSLSSGEIVDDFLPDDIVYPVNLKVVLA